MGKAPKETRNWLVAAWPGMANVAVIAAGYLVQKLGMQAVAELAARGHFHVQHVEVKAGLIAVPRTPRSLIFRSPDPKPGRDFTVFLGEAQPTDGAYAFAHALLDRAQEYGVERVVTFASMASQLHPSQQPRVFGAATQPGMLDELQRLEVQLLAEGQVSGLNGVILGAAAERGMAGLCLLGEIPFFAAGVANPKAAKAVLDAFSLLAGVELDLEELSKHAETIDAALIEMLERMQREGGDDEEGGMPAGLEAAPEPEPEPEPKPAEPAMDYATRSKIERLFEEARKDRSKSMRLKRELDKLGVFKQFEDRFLDLFRRAE